MRNRAKCKLCNSIIESCHEHDYVGCACGQIAITGGQMRLTAMASDWANFLRVDDMDNVIVPKILDHSQNEEVTNQEEKHTEKPTRQELLNLLQDMIKRIEELPPVAMSTYITHYDFGSALMLLLSILRADCIDES